MSIISNNSEFAGHEVTPEDINDLMDWVLGEDKNNNSIIARSE